MVAFEREDVMGVRLDDLFGDGFLAAHCVAGDDAAAEFEDAQELGNGGDLMRPAGRTPSGHVAPVVFLE